MLDKKAKMIELRNSGMTHREIAKRFGCSPQYVAVVCSKSYPAHFIPIGDNCVYPNLRRWMNEHKINRRELMRRMGLTLHASNYSRLNDYLRGASLPRKDYIDKMLEATGMTYEVLFSPVLTEISKQ